MHSKSNTGNLTQPQLVYSIGWQGGRIIPITDCTSMSDLGRELAVISGVGAGVISGVLRSPEVIMKSIAMRNGCFLLGLKNP